MNPALPTNINSGPFMVRQTGGLHRYWLSHLCRATASRILPGQGMYELLQLLSQTTPWSCTEGIRERDAS